MFKLEDIRVNSLVTFKKHNGKGKEITYRSIFIGYISYDKDSVFIGYDCFEGVNYLTLYKEELNKDYEIIDIKYFDFRIEDNKSIVELVKGGNTNE